jgi:hypothetical protein
MGSGGSGSMGGGFGGDRVGGAGAGAAGGSPAGAPNQSGYGPTPGYTAQANTNYYKAPAGYQVVFRKGEPTLIRTTAPAPQPPRTVAGGAGK